MKVKICGLSRPADIEAVNQYQPDYAGFIINFPKSHRNCTPEQVQVLHAQLSDSIPAVGVTVNQPLETVAALLEQGVIDIAQLHGQEDESYIDELKWRTGKPVWKAFRIRSADDLDAARASSADMILLDNGYGTGETFDWTLVRDIGRPFILAGGLCEDNIDDAAKMQPDTMDISSGVETNRVKDPEKIRTLIERIRSI
ncbi:phosphoribosylanthranilate isomerase [Butyricicoccus sp.]|uniref:phosphoribosylanthranilate isomerase n=1 Tax=Butyricicoccus sp. TaxID=2049021 RepID=UPI003D7D7439